MPDNPFVLASTMNSASMIAAYMTREAAMEAAVKFVQGQADIIYRGSLSERWEMARDWWTGQGGEMEIIQPNVL